MKKKEHNCKTCGWRCVVYYDEPGCELSVLTYYCSYLDKEVNVDDYCSWWEDDPEEE